MKLAVFFMLGLGAFAGKTARAESRDAKPKATLTKTLVADEPKPLLAEIDIRPSWNSTDGHFFTFDTAELGYQTKKFRFSYVQMILTELAQYGDKKDRPAVRAYDGYVRIRANDIWKHDRTALTYETRFYLPTDANKRGNGMITIWQNAFRIVHTISPAVTMLFQQTPVLHAYSVAGMDTTANPLLESQTVLEFDWAIPGTSWLFQFPLFYSAKYFRDFKPKAENNASWTHWFEIYPELDYAFDPGLTLGIAYESGNILTLENNADPTKAPELTSGTVQLIFRSRL